MKDLLLVPARNKEVRDSVEEIMRVAEQGPTEGSERVAIDSSTITAFRQHFSQRMYQVLSPKVSSSYNVIVMGIPHSM